MSLWPVGDLSGSRRAAGLRDPRLAGLPLAAPSAGVLEGRQDARRHRVARHPSTPSNARSGVIAATAATSRSRAAHRSGPCRWASRATERDLRQIIVVRARLAAS